MARTAMATIAASPEADPHATASVAERWATLLRNTTYEALGDEALAAAKRCLLDFLGVALAGSTQPIAQLSAQYYVELGGKPEAKLIGRGGRLPAPNAAFVNGVAGHALDMDDGHRAAAGHPGVTVIPAALAAAEIAGASGRDLLRAIVLGYEVFVRLAAAINPAHLERGFHTTATVGPFGAAAAAGLLLDLSEAQLVNALGLAGVQGAGLMEVFHDGAEAKPFQVGRATSAGLLAAILAQRGANGPRTILEGEQGFLNALVGDRARAAHLADNWGDTWLVGGAYYKAYAACRHTHAAIDAALALRDDHGVRPDDVQAITVRTYAVADKLCGTTVLPEGPAEAKFSLPFAVALGLVLGRGGPACFTPERVHDPALRAVASRMGVVVDPAFEARYPVERGAALDARLADGREVTVEVPLARGEPEIPFTQREIEAKFFENAEGVLPLDRAEAVRDAVHNLDAAPDCASLLALL